MKMRLLGCGTSSGVPRIGDDWGQADPSDPRNRRLRQSAIIETETTRILIDTGPDLRQQLLAAKVDRVDAIIWTHDHADHCHGIDDVRQLFHGMGRPVIGYARPATAAVLKGRFGYVFTGLNGYPPVAAIHDLPDRLVIGDISVGATDQPHGSITSAGLRFDHNGIAIGYATDFHEMTDDMRSLYASLDLWLVDALRRRPHPSHPTLKQALGWIQELTPRRSVLIHLDQSMDYAALAAELPAGVEPGQDGLDIAL